MNNQLQETKLRILRDTDWTQLPDSPLDEETKAAWAEFRQAIRDLDQHADPAEVDWPSAPYTAQNT